MSERDDGGRAFPNRAYGPPFDGMSLREWFAGKAMAGMGTQSLVVDGFMHLSTEPEWLKARAEWAVAQADAMIEALRK